MLIGQRHVKIADTVDDVVIQRLTCRAAGLKREHRETHLDHQEFEQPVFQLHELTSAVSCLAKTDYLHVPQDLLQRLKILEPVARLEMADRESVVSQPAANRLLFCP